MPVYFTNVDNILRVTSPVRVTKATIAAMTRTLKSGEAEAKRQIRSRYNIKLAELGQRMKGYIRSGGLKGEIIARDKRIPLMQFGARQTGVRVIRKTKSLKFSGRRATAGGVRVEITKGKPVVRRHAFITQVGSGHIGVFERKGKKRLPIGEQTGPAAAQMFKKPEVMTATKRKIGEVWDKQFASAMRYYGKSTSINH